MERNPLRSPHQKYYNDPQYQALVDAMYAHIENADFTPSEIREAAMMACIKFEMNRVRYMEIPGDVEGAIRVLSDYGRKE